MNSSLPQSENIPAKWQEFYNHLSEARKSLYEQCVRDLEDNPEFMLYAEKYNKNPEDPFTDNMYVTVNYKMCLLRDVVRLDALKLLDAGAKREIIFDIGCGTGYFPYFAKKAGHIVYCLDAPLETCGQRIFADGQKALGLDVIRHTIKPLQPLPSLPEQISLAVSFSPHFYSPSTEDFWRKEEWQYFLKDLAQKMTEDGKCYFHLNNVIPMPEFGVFGTEETKNLFYDIGHIERGYIVTIETEKIKTIQ